MSPAHPIPRILVAGGGVAALELLLALRANVGSPLAITLLSADAAFAPPAMTVAEPFERGGAQTHDWREITARLDVRLVLDRLVAVDTDAHRVFTHDGRRIPYDVLVIATGARRVEPLAGALTFGVDAAAGPALRALIDDARRSAARIAFALPWPSSWSLPLYELALLTAHELREHDSPALVRIVTPERRALELLGPAAGEAVMPILSAVGVELVAGVQPRAVVSGGLRLDDEATVEADHVVTIADVVARPVPGLPTDRAGFIPVDAYGLVTAEPDVYAVGEVTSFPLRQGGLAAQQADVVADAIIARYAGGEPPRPFAPVLRARLTTSGAPLYLQARPSGRSLASYRAMWSPPEKVAGRYLAPYLATARPELTLSATLAERVPAVAGEPGDEHAAVKLALTVAAAEARCHNRSRALQALDAALALEPDLDDPSYLALRGRLAEQVPAG
ncbi:MAG: FAD-dependent oxidoreductase [Solirubrobacteraceae bacterium]|nr:FAD-dependent oxidoreductase [Solirubrobacteraceae bacterium]